MIRASTSLLLSIVLASPFASWGALRADDVEPRAADPFVRTIEPLVRSKCVTCHGAEKQEAGLRLDSLAAALKGGDSGPAIMTGDVAKSLLVKAVRFLTEVPGRGALSHHPCLDHDARSRGSAPDRRQIRFQNGALLKAG